MYRNNFTGEFCYYTHFLEICFLCCFESPVIGNNIGRRVITMKKAELLKTLDERKKMLQQYLEFVHSQRKSAPKGVKKK
jgi:hypothetical protein